MTGMEGVAGMAGMAPEQLIAGQPVGDPPVGGRPVGDRPVGDGSVGDRQAVAALDPEQRQVANSARSVLFLGAPGTGKTTALQHAASNAGHRVLVVVPGRAAARRWQAGWVALTPGGLVPTITTVAGLALHLLTGFAASDDAEPWLLTAPEQELRVRELLAGTVSDASVPWPAELKSALTTRSFSRQLRRAVAHARRLGWDPQPLAALARERRDDYWFAVAVFLEQYLQVLDWQGALDYGEAVLRASRRLEAGAPSPFAAVGTVIVDDAQDYDPMQLRLVRACVARGARIVAAADPDAGVASYRGADLAAVVELARTVDQVVVARVGHRGGARIRQARSRLLRDGWYAGLPAGAAAGFRDPAVVSDRPDAVVAWAFPDARTQARHLAALLHARHRAGAAWRDLAVLVTRPREELPTLARVLADSAVPIHVPATDVALAEQGAVATVLRAATLVLTDPMVAAGTDDRWAELACSGMGGLTNRALRQVRTWLAGVAREPHELLLGNLAGDDLLADAAPPGVAHAVAALTRLGRRLAAARAALASGGSPAEVLWLLWQGPGTGPDWPDRLRRRAGGTGAGAAAANRDLDAMVQLFRLAERAPQRLGGRGGLGTFIETIEHLEIPAEPDLKLASNLDAVELVSLHRATGRTWRHIVVTGMAESAWRDSELGGGLLAPHRLTEHDLLPVAPRTAAAERRRLLATALGRAGESVVFASAGGEDDPPTPLLREAGIEVTHLLGEPERPVNANDLFLRLRSDAATGADERRDQAIAALPHLLDARDGTGGQFPALDPLRWPGARDWTTAPVPLRDPARPLRLTSSGMRGLVDCPLQWFLHTECRGSRPAGAAAGFGLIAHAVAAELVTGGPDADPEELLARYWSDDGYDAQWYAQVQREEATTAVRRAATWLRGRSAELAAEVPIDARLPVTRDGVEVDRIHVTGRIDLVEHGDAGAVIWDYKTGATLPTRAAAGRDPQLALYQAAYQADSGAPVQGAGLLYLRKPAGARDPDSPKTLQQPGLDDPELRRWTADTIHAAAAAIRAERFAARPGPACRACQFQASCPAKGES